MQLLLGGVIKGGRQPQPPQQEVMPVRLVLVLMEVVVVLEVWEVLPVDSRLQHHQQGVMLVLLNQLVRHNQYSRFFSKNNLSNSNMNSLTYTY
jgi:hypothetical protein